MYAAICHPLAWKSRYPHKTIRPMNIIVMKWTNSVRGVCSCLSLNESTNSANSSKSVVIFGLLWECSVASVVIACTAASKAFCWSGVIVCPLVQTLHNFSAISDRNCMARRNIPLQSRFRSRWSLIQTRLKKWTVLFFQRYPGLQALHPLGFRFQLSSGGHTWNVCCRRVHGGVCICSSRVCSFGVQQPSEFQFGGLGNFGFGHMIFMKPKSIT